MHRNAVVLFLVAIYLVSCVKGYDTKNASCSNMRAVLQSLEIGLAEYDRSLAPAQTVSVDVRVNIRFAVIDEDKATVRIIGEIVMAWEDPRITWNATEFGCYQVLIDAESLWVPSVGIDNVLDYGTSSELYRAGVWSDGSVQWSKSIDSIAALWSENWPPQSALATYVIAAKPHADDLLNFTISEDAVWSVKSARQWSITCSLELIDDVINCNVLALRKSSGSLTPLVAATLLILTSLAMPLDKRYPIAISAVLIIVLWLSTSAQAPLSRVRAACGSCVVAALTALISAFASRLQHRKETAPRPLTAAFATEEPYVMLATPQESDGDRGRVTWTTISQIIDKVLTVAVIITIIGLACAEL